MRGNALSAPAVLGVVAGAEAIVSTIGARTLKPKDSHLSGLSLELLGDAAWRCGDYVTASRCFEESAMAFHLSGDHVGTACARLNQGELQCFLANRSAARVAIEERVALAEIVNNAELLAYARKCQGMLD